MTITKIVFFSLPVLYIVYNVLTYLKTRVPIVITPKSYYNELFKNFEIKKDKVIYELGCGRGDFLFTAEQYKPKKLVGFELAFLHAYMGKFVAWKNKSKAQILCKDFFKVDISDADIIYLYLVVPILKRSWDKIKKETKPGTIVITLSDEIPGEDYFQRIATRPGNSKTTYYYLYKVK